MMWVGISFCVAIIVVVLGAVALYQQTRGDQ
jgi:hypothetical protein